MGKTMKGTKEMRLTISRKTRSQKIFRQKTEKVQVTKLPEYLCDWKRFLYKFKKLPSFAYEKFRKFGAWVRELFVF